MTIPLLITILGCFLIFYQDYKNRWISIYSFLVLAIGTATNIQNIKYDLFIFLINLIFLATLLLILKVYIILRKGVNEALINRYIGSGDILMLFILCFSYNLPNYTLIILASSFTGLVYWLIRHHYKKSKTIRIPLAAAIASVHFVTLIIGHLMNFSFIDSQIL